MNYSMLILLLPLYIACCGAAFFFGYRSGIKSVPKPKIPLDKLETMMADCFALLDHIEGARDWSAARQRFQIAEKAGFEVEYNFTDMPERPKESEATKILQGGLSRH
jgi:hypothetical protein